MLDQDFSTLAWIESYQASRAYRAPGAEKNSDCPLSSNYTGGLHLDRHNANKSLIDVSGARAERWRASAVDST
jgi:hypothetical protein